MGELHPLRQGPAVEPLWRDVLGRQLRRLRLRRGRTIVATARRAGISAQYLSEVERGRKDPSSEVVAAIAGALECTVAEITDLTVRDLRRAVGHRASSPARGPVALAA